VDVFNLYAKLSLNTDDYEKGVEKAKGGASSLMDVFSGTLLGNVVSDGLRTVANGITEIGKTAANMAVSIGKASLDSYADYEQLVGGVETLYKDSAGIIENYAKDAYKNVGLSANDYMETSTSFAAALVSSLGGDTNKAAEMANTAISDMSDNANKMGTNMQSIQDAYNGFAKQNYTMLDNLKIGYGGTQAEMKRLIKEAAAMTDTQKELGVTVDSNSMSYANIVQAIHVVQANMGIMGTTSKEAATTIQGSTASMKSAWENLLTGIADPEQDFQALVDNLVDSVITAGNNIIPRIKEIVPTLIDGLSELVTQLAPYVSGVIMELEPTIEEGLQALFGGLSSVASELQPIVADVFSFFGDAIISGLTSAIESSDFSFLLDIFNNVKTAIENIANIIDSFKNNANAAWDAISAKIQEVVAFVQPYVEAAMQVIGQVVTQVITDLTPVIQSIGEAFSAAWSLVQTVWAWASAFFQAIFQSIVVIFTPFAPIISGFFQGAWIIIQSIWNVAVSFFQTVFDLITGVFSTIDAVLSGDFQGAWESIQGIFEGVFGFFSTVGQNAVEGIKGGIAAVWNGLVSFVQGLWDGIKSIFVINASDVKNNTGSDGSHAGGMDYVPYNNYVANLHRGEMVLTADEADEYRKGTAKTAGGMTINIDVNGIQFSDVNSMAHALANQISYELQAQSNRKAAVYA
jgi:phage-related protein